MYILNKKQPEKLNEVTFAELGYLESDLKEILRLNIDILCNDEESMLIVGQGICAICF